MNDMETTDNNKNKVGCVLRIYPNQEQIHTFRKWTGGLRFAWNNVLAEVNRQKEETGKLSVDKKTLYLYGYNLKKQHEWLKEIPVNALNYIFEDQMYLAFKRFFDKNLKNAKYPRFKSKHGKQPSIYIHNQKCNIDIENNRVKLPKIKEYIKFRGSIPDNAIRYYSGRVKEHAGKWYLSAVFECNKVEVESVGKHEVVGVDAGVKSLATVYNGDGFYISPNPKAYVNNQKKLARLQRQKSRGVPNSKRNIKKKLQIQKLHAKIVNIRKDNAHKESKKIIDMGQKIVIESLNVGGMMKSRRQSKSIADASMGTFSTYIKYKAEKYGRTIEMVGQFYPSSKLCSNCGEKNDKLGRKDMFHCDSCGHEMQRDHNAAMNLWRVGIGIAGHART